MRTLVVGATLALSMALAGCGSSDQQEDDPVSVPSNSERDAGSTEGGDSASNAGTQADAGGEDDRSDAASGSTDAEGEEDDEGSGLPTLGGEAGAEAVEISTILDSSDGLNGPRDAEFKPEKPGQLWVVNRTDHSAVVATDTATDSQSAQKYDGPNSRHFLAKPAALSFGEPGEMATAQQENEQTQPDTPEDFMGVTLWQATLEDFDGGHASHLDMLHNSPLASGISWEGERKYWVFDGAHGAIAMYDFVEDHGPGGQDHSDGVVRRYIDGELAVEEGVVAHVALDRESGLLYIADTGNQRIQVLDTETGEVGDPISPNYDGTDQKYVDGAESHTLVDGSEVELKRPAGLELHDGHLYVSDNQTSTVHAFTLEGEHVDSLDLSEEIPEGGAMGMVFDDEGRLYVVDAEEDEIHQISPSDE